MIFENMKIRSDYDYAYLVLATRLKIHGIYCFRNPNADFSLKVEYSIKGFHLEKLNSTIVQRANMFWF